MLSHAKQQSTAVVPKVWRDYRTLLRVEGFWLKKEGGLVKRLSLTVCFLV